MTRWRLPGGLRLWVGGGSLLLVAIALWTHGQEVLALAPDQRGWALLLLGLSLTVAAQWANGLAWWALLRCLFTSTIIFDTASARPVLRPF